MPDAIGPLNRPPGIEGLGASAPQRAQPKSPEGGFQGALGGLVEQVDAMQHEAADAISRFAAGDGENLHEMMIAVSKAELSFKFLMEARNKLVDAYRDVMRMQL
ncbi:MAG: flagellar hook-basal body complex protein FliE [Candidatus Brocadiia bacterium]